MKYTSPYILGILVWWLIKEPTSKNCLDILSGQFAVPAVEFLTLDPAIPAVILTKVS